MLAPAAPHITEELWSRRLAAAGEPWSSIHSAVLAGGRPGATVVEATREVPVQVNGKLRDKVTVPTGIDAAELEAAALARPKVAAALAGRTPDRVIQPAAASCQHRRPRLRARRPPCWPASLR